MRTLNILIILMFFSNIAFAQTNVNVNSEFDIPSYKFNTSIYRTTECFYDGVPCGISIDCFMTVFYPNVTIAINDSKMSFINNGIYNYTITKNYTEIIGDYRSFVKCNNSDIKDIDDSSFRIVGKLLYSGGGIVVWQLALVFGLIGIGIMFSFLSSFTKSFPMRAMFLFGALIVIITTNGLLIEFASIEAQTDSQSILTSFYNLSVWFSVIVLFLFLLNFFIDLLDVFGKLPDWAQKIGKRKNKLEKEEE